MIRRLGVVAGGARFLKLLERPGLTASAFLARPRGMPMKLSPRQRLLKAAHEVVAKSVSEDTPLYAAIEAKRLLTEHPNCGMSEREITEMLLQLAVGWNLVIDTMDDS